MSQVATLRREPVEATPRKKLSDARKARIHAALSPNQPTEQADSGAVSTGAIGGQS